MKLDIYLECEVCGSSNRRTFLPARLDGLEIFSPEYFSPYNSHSGHFQIVECLECKFLYSTPIADINKLGYQEAPTESLRNVLYWKEKTAKKELELIEYFLPKGKLLEIGSGLGAFLNVAKERGWDAVGIEPNRDAVIFSQKRGLAVIEGFFDAGDFPSNRFDCIVFAGVLDHLFSPRSVVKDCYRLLRSGGGIWATVVNGRGFLAKILKGNFPGFQYQHLYYFSKQTLGRFFESLDYKILHIASNKVTYPFFYYGKVIEHSFPNLSQLLQKIPILSHVSPTLSVGNLEVLVRKL